MIGDYRPILQPIYGDSPYREVSRSLYSAGTLDQADPDSGGTSARVPISGSALHGSVISDRASVTDRSEQLARLHLRTEPIYPEPGAVSRKRNIFPRCGFRGDDLYPGLRSGRGIRLFVAAMKGPESR